MTSSGGDDPVPIPADSLPPGAVSLPSSPLLLSCPSPINGEDEDESNATTDSERTSLAPALLPPQLLLVASTFISREDITSAGGEDVPIITGLSH